MSGEQLMRALGKRLAGSARGRLICQEPLVNRAEGHLAAFVLSG